ncbi:hypothetical protein SCUP234_12318 [Seiridium cupressi]
MIALFLGGTVCALGHHLYYANLDDTVVVNITSRWNLEAVRDSQEWKIRFGTGFAFFTKTMFAAAVAIAYQQRLWVTTRKQTVTINGLDAMFSAANNIFSFAILEFLRRAKLGAALALLVWSNDTNPLSDDWLMFLRFAATCLTEAAMWSSAFDSIPLCEGIIIPPGGSNSLANVSSIYDDADYYNYRRTWVWAQNATYDCILTDTEYDVGFSYSLSENTQRVDPQYDFRWTGNDLYGSYFPIADAVANLLGGSVRGLFTGITSYKTRVSETAIFGALKADTSSQYATNSGPSPAILTSDIKDLAHNKSVGQLIEELSRNVTLSLFSADKILSLDNTTTMVTTTANVNVYSYNRQNLILTYAITFALALLGLIAGCVAYLQNGVSYDNSFSAFMLTTRNKRFDELAKGRSMGAMPLENEVKKTELRFGLLQGDKDGFNNEGSRRVGF